MIIRSSNLDKVDISEVKQFKSIINGVIDLRFLFQETPSKKFVENKLKYFNEVIDVKPLYKYYTQIGKGKIKNKIDARFQFLIDLIEEEKTIDDILNAIVECDFKAWIYCNNGRYRTGFICYLMQFLFGLSKEEIVNDFVLSSKNIDDGESCEEEKLSVEEATEFIERLYLFFIEHNCLNKYQYFKKIYFNKVQNATFQKGQKIESN